MPTRGKIYIHCCLLALMICCCWGMTQNMRRQGYYHHGNMEIDISDKLIKQTKESHSNLESSEISGSNNHETATMKRKKRSVQYIKCGGRKVLNIGSVYKLGYPKYPKCIYLLQAANKDTELSMTCRLFSMKTYAIERMRITTNSRSHVFCKEKPAKLVKEASKLFIRYSRKYQVSGSKLLCFIVGRKATTYGEQYCNSCGQVKILQDSRIIGGIQTRAGEIPWMALLTFDVGSSQGIGRCGGSIINSRTILTAAHCVAVRKLNAINVFVGEHDINKDNEEHMQKFKTSRYIIHPGYDQYLKHQYNDIALVKLNSDIKFSNYVTPICIAPPDTYDGQRATITGWGSQKYQDVSSLLNVLNKVTLDVWDQSKCKSNYQEKGLNVTNNQLCANSVGKDSCQGDSGGPLVVIMGTKWYQIGLVSYGLNCAEERYPGVYTRPSSYYYWITQSMEKGGCP